MYTKAGTRDGYIDMKELKKVTAMLGTMLTKEEIEEFMAEADKVRKVWQIVTVGN